MLGKSIKTAKRNDVGRLLQRLNIQSTLGYSALAHWIRFSMLYIYVILIKVRTYTELIVVKSDRLSAKKSIYYEVYALMIYCDLDN